MQKTPLKGLCNVHPSTLKLNKRPLILLKLCKTPISTGLTVNSTNCRSPHTHRCKDNRRSTGNYTLFPNLPIPRTFVLKIAMHITRQNTPPTMLPRSPLAIQLGAMTNERKCEIALIQNHTYLN